VSEVTGRPRFDRPEPRRGSTSTPSRAPDLGVGPSGGRRRPAAGTPAASTRAVRAGA
jgi:hypothetical protein